MTSSKEFREFDSAILADRLAFLALSLFVIYLITLVAAIVPIRLLETSWQLRFIAACLDTAAIPLVGLGLLHLAAYLDPGNPALQKRRAGLARLAVLAVVGFLLIIPLQASAGWRSVSLAKANAARQLATATSTFDLLQDTITSATSLDNLQARLQAIQAPSLGIPLDTINQPLPETRRLLLARLQQVRRQVEGRLQAPPPGTIETMVKDSLRVILSALALAIAFAMGAQRKGSAVPLLVEWHTMLSVRGPGPGHPADDVLRALPLPGGRRPAESDYFSRLVPEEAPTEPSDDPGDSGTGLPPPP